MDERTDGETERKKKKLKTETFDIYNRHEEVLAVSMGKWRATQKPAMKLV
jgi:hypothetical protein